MKNCMRSETLKLPLKNKYALLRHGQTDANGKKIYMGRLDFDLNSIGIEQAEQTVLPFTPDITLYSPLKRAAHTATLVTNGIKVVARCEERLIEKAGGDIDGLQYTEIAEKYPEVWGIWDDMPLDYIVKAKFPDGESDLDVVGRLEELFAELENDHTGRNILLVTHSGVMQCARYLFGQSKKSIYFLPVPNCQLELY